MSFILPSPQSCCDPCPSPQVENIPGPPGAAGTNGTNGTNGVNAYTLTTAPFVMPAKDGGLVAVNVGQTAWMTVGQKVFVGQFGQPASGTFEVSQVASSAVVVLINSETSAGEYAGNSEPGTIFNAASTVSPSGLQGPSGAAGAGGAPTDATYVTQTPNASLPSAYPLNALSTGLLHVTTAVGVDSVKAESTAAGQQAPNDGALTAGQVVLASASGIKTDTAANVRTALALGTMATQNANAVAITGGTLANVTITNSTVSPPGGLVAAWMVYQNQQATTVNAGGLGASSWVTVPLNTEVIDTGGDGSLSANVVTLAAGTYRFRWSVPCYLTGKFATRLVSGVSTVLAYGSNAKSDSTDLTSDTSDGWWRDTVIAGTQVRLEAQAQTAATGTGFGLANGFGGTEVYSTLEIEKES